MTTTPTPDKLGLLSSSTITNDFSNTVPIGMSYYQKNDNTYAFLESIRIPFESDSAMKSYLRQPRVSLRRLNGRIKLTNNGLVNRIELVDFPYGQYTLSLNGRNVATAKYDKKNCKHYFDFTDSGTRSHELDIFISITKGFSEPIIENRHEYLNFDRIDNVEIIYSGLCENLKEMHNIVIHGHLLVNSKYVEMSKNIIVFPNTYILQLEHVVESMDIETNGNGNGNIVMKLCEDDIAFFNVKSPNMRIKFNNPNKHYYRKLLTTGLDDKTINYCNSAFGCINDFLSEEININTINLYGKTLSIVPIGCEIKCITFHCYIVYKYPERIPF